MNESTTTFEQRSVQSGGDGLGNTVLDRLRWLIPAAAAMSYPFWLDAFHSAVSPSSGSMSLVQMVEAAFCLFAAFTIPLLGLGCAFWMTTATFSSFELRSRRLAYITIAVPPFFVLTGVGLGLLHVPVSDELVWIMGWSAACLYVLFGGERARASAASPRPAARSVARWRVVHGVTAAVILIYVLFHLTNHLFGLLGPDVHAEIMKMGRRIYRSPFVEPILVGLLLFQVIVGARLAWHWSSVPADVFRVFQTGSGTYLAAFILAHLNSALISARAMHHIETDWAWASGAPIGLIHDPWSIRLVPHYALGVFFVLSHLCSGLRIVLLAHRISAPLANRSWAAGLGISGLVSAAIISALCGARI
jgi:hypothetical protein